MIHILGAVPLEFEAQIGRICVKWSELEQRLVLAYSGLLRIHYSAAHHSLAQVTSVQMRIKMLRGALKEFPLAPEVTEELSATLKLAGDTAMRRNEFVHGRWGTRAGFGRGSEEIVLMDPRAVRDDNKFMRTVNTRELMDVADGIENLVVRFDRVIEHLRPIPEEPSELEDRRTR